MSGDRAVTAGVGAAARREVDWFGLLAKFAPLLFLLVLMAVFAIVEPRFLKPLNLFNVMRQVSIYGLLAIGMTFVILTGGIDLSVGSVVALAGLAAALVAKGGLESRFAVGTESEAHGWGWASKRMLFSRRSTRSAAPRRATNRGRCSRGSSFASKATSSLWLRPTRTGSRSKRRRCPPAAPISRRSFRRERSRSSCASLPARRTSSSVSTRTT